MTLLFNFSPRKHLWQHPKPNTMEFALTIKEVERISEQLKQPLYKASLQLLLCEALLETEPFRAQHIHSTVDIVP